MSDTTGSTASQANPGGGSAGDGSGATGTPAGFVPQAQLEQAEARRRATQSNLDKALAGNSELAQRLSQVETMLSGIDPVKIADTIQSRLAQASAIQSAAEGLRKEFPYARAEVFEGKYESVDALKAAVQQSHAAEDQYRTTVREEEYGKLAEKARAAGLVLDPAPQTPSAGSGAEDGKLTVASLAAMSSSELDKISDEQIQRAMASA